MLFWEIKNAQLNVQAVSLEVKKKEKWLFANYIHFKEVIKWDWIRGREEERDENKSKS